jgi:hypothetical protein
MQSVLIKLILIKIQLKEIIFISKYCNTKMAKYGSINYLLHLLYHNFGAGTCWNMTPITCRPNKMTAEFDNLVKYVVTTHNEGRE